MAYRYWCGECGFKTPWLTQFQGERQQLDHYASRHPDVEPGGHVEVNRKNPGGGVGCLPATTVVLVLLLVVAFWHR